MIKRDTIQRVIMKPIEDGQAGKTFKLEPKELITVAVSIGATMSQVAEFGSQTQLTLNVVSNIKLDEYKNARYIFSGKHFKLMRQVKQGNEYFSVLLEVNE